MDISSTIAAFLTHVRVERGLSANTVTAYRRDLVKFDDFAKKRNSRWNLFPATISWNSWPACIAKSSKAARWRDTW
jgi:Site-specific recombinase XerD